MTTPTPTTDKMREPSATEIRRATLYNNSMMHANSGMNELKTIQFALAALQFMQAALATKENDNG